MGRQSDEALQLADADELVNYLMGAHCAYMQWRELTYYLTDANDIYWRAQDTNELNLRPAIVVVVEATPIVVFIDIVSEKCHRSFEQGVLKYQRRVVGYADIRNCKQLINREFARYLESKIAA